MTIPHIFATQPAGNVLASYLDDNFTAVEERSVFNFMTAAQIADIQAYSYTPALDPTAALNTAFAAGVGYCPTGGYRLSATLVRPVGLRVYGDSLTKTIFKFYGTTNTDFFDSTADADYGGVADIYFNGNSLARDGLRIRRSWASTAQRCKVTGCIRDGVTILGDNVVTTRGAYYTGLQDVWSSGNNRYGITLDTESSGGDRCNANTLINCTAQGNLGGGFYFGRAGFNTVIGGSAEVNGQVFTSATSITVGTGALTPTITTGQIIEIGNVVRLSRTSDLTNTWMFGTVTGYTSGTGALAVTITNVGTGTGTFTDWTITVGAGIIFTSGALSNSVYGIDSEQNGNPIPMNLVFNGTTSGCNKVLSGSVGDSTSTVYGGTPDYTNFCWAYSGTAAGRVDGNMSFGQAPSTPILNGIGSPARNVVGSDGGATTYANSWAAYTAGGFTGATYWKDAAGYVHIEGAVKSGASATIAWTMPAGYLPTTAKQFAVSAGAAGITPSNVFIGTSGSVVVTSADNSFVALNFMYRTD
jgi:parallel beta-helix repeat protein